MTDKTPADARGHECRAADHMICGRFAAAREEYRLAQWAWMEIATRLAAHGETALTDCFRAEAEKNERKYDATFWLEIEGREGAA